MPIRRLVPLTLLASLTAGPAVASDGPGCDATPCDAVAGDVFLAPRSEWLDRSTLLSWPGGDGESASAENRPNFTESASAVGRGAAVLETGYTYVRRSDADPTSIHSFGEPALRVGGVADWLELSVASTYVVEDAAGEPGAADGARDLYLGAKIALTPQSGFLPKTAIIPQMLVPTGADAFSGREALAGAAFVYGWQVTEDLSVAGGTQANRARNGSSPASITGFGFNPDAQPGDGDRGAYTEWTQSLVVGAALTERVGAFGEYVGFYPTGVDLRGEHYLLGGGTYQLTDTTKLGLRYGVGLNDAAADYFVGPTLSIDLR